MGASLDSDVGLGLRDGVPAGRATQANGMTLLEASIRDLERTIAHLDAARKWTDITCVVPSGEASLRQVRHALGEALDELKGLYHEYAGQVAGGE